MKENLISTDTKSPPTVEHSSDPYSPTRDHLEPDYFEELIEATDEEDGLTREWGDELIQRSEMLHTKLEGSETDRREAALVHKAGVIIKALRQGQGIAPKVAARHLGVEPGFIAFLENGLVSLDEVYPKLRDPLAAALDVEPRVVDLIFETS